MSKRWIITTILVIVLGVAYLFATPYITLYQIKQAIDHKDINKVSSYIDYSSVKTNLKHQFASQLNIEHHSSNPLLKLGALFADTLGDKALDQLISPDGLRLVLKGQDLLASDEQDNNSAQNSSDPKSVTMTMGYASLNSFKLDIHPKNKYAPTVRVLLGREGLTWKVKAIEFLSQD